VTTFYLITYKVTPAYADLPIDSIFVLSGDYAIAMTVWVLAIAAFIIERRNNLTTLTSLLIVTVFNSVFYGFLVAYPGLTYINTDGVNQVFYTNYIVATGHIGQATGAYAFFNYFDIPGFQTLGASYNLVVGSSVLQSSVMLEGARVIMWSLVLFAFFRKFLVSNLNSVLAAILLSDSMWILSDLNYYHPDAFSMVVFTAELIALTIIVPRGANSGTTVTVLIQAGLTLIAPQAAFAASFAMTGIYVASKLSRKSTSSITTILAMWLIPAGYIIYTSQIFPSIVTSLSLALNFGYLNAIGTTSFGGGIPSWVVAWRLGWIVLVVFVGVAIWLRQLLNLRKLDQKTIITFGIIAGLLAYEAASVFIGQGVQYYRLLQYAGMIFAVLIVAGVTERHRKAIPRYAVMLIVVILLICSIPSFYTYNPKITYAPYHPSDISFAAFVASSLPPSAPTLTDPDIGALVLVSYPISEVFTALPYEHYVILGSPLVWSWNVVFQWANSATNGSVTLLSSRLVADYAYNLHIPKNDSNWTYLRSQLITEDVVFNSPAGSIYLKV
jgi:hypothetical protein